MPLAKTKTEAMLTHEKGCGVLDGDDAVSDGGNGDDTSFACYQLLL